MNSTTYWIAVVLVTVIASARITRLLTFDKFPPIVMVRDWYSEKTDPSDWQLLSICAYCMGVWTSALVVGTGYAAHVYGHPPNDLWFRVWWLAAGWLAVSYLTGIFVARDKGQVGE